MKRLIGWFMNLFKLKHNDDPKPGEDRGFIPIPSHATFRKLTFQIHGLEKFTEKEKEKFMSAISLGTIVLNSKEFKDMVSQYTYSENQGLSGYQIWQLLCTGKDLYNPENDYDIDVFVTMYHNFWTGTVGYTFPDTFKTWINRKFFQDFNEAEILGNVIHEALHNFGFTHKDITKRDDSVPYKVGYFARDLASRLTKGEELTPLRAV
jgi:hypothetical protein